MQECGRRSNMVRHIGRLHGAIGNPVKEKPSATGSSVRNIHVVEVDDSISKHWNFLPTNFGKVADGHWAYRALEAGKRKGITVIDERELMEFLRLEKSTFAIFCVGLRGEEKNLYAYLGPELDKLGNW
jgi:hypothetical protein